MPPIDSLFTTIFALLVAVPLLILVLGVTNILLKIAVAFCCAILDLILRPAFGEKLLHRYLDADDGWRAILSFPSVSEATTLPQTLFGWVTYAVVTAGILLIALVVAPR